MATVLQQDKSSLLRNTLKGNALFSVVSGAAFLLGAGALASLMGVDQPILLAVLGVGVIGFAFAVFYVANQTPLDSNKGRIILVMDILWVVGSVLLLIADPLSFTNEGKWAVLIIADIVGVFAILEYLGLRRLR